MSGQSDPLVVKDLTVAYRRRGGVDNVVVAGVDMALRRGEIMGLAGESGCGKSTTALAAIGYRAPGVRILTGTSALDGTDLLGLSARQLRGFWGNRLSYVAQNATTALNPAIRIGEQIAQPLRLHLGLKGDTLRARQVELLGQVHIPAPESALRRYPHQFSGGQQQRIAIAIAIACGPEVLILDEPTTGLDVTTQSRISALLRELVTKTGVATLYVSHDLALLSTVADRLAVMYAGEIVEQGPVEHFLAGPSHPYTRALLDSVPSARERRAVSGIPGRPPLRVVLDACAFAPRCDLVVEACTQSSIELVAQADGSAVRCLRANERSQRSVRTLEQVSTTEGGALLDVRAISARYPGATAQVLSDVTFTVASGETLGVVGESGSGKSTLLRCIAGLHPPISGEVAFDGQMLAAKAVRRPREIRGRMQIVFQNPDTSLNPRQSVAQLVGRPLRLFRDDVSRGDEERVVLELLDQVQLPGDILHRYPSELSGGQKQRVNLARAFAAKPRVLLCDEVTSALDVSVQATVIEVIAAIAAETGTSVVFVSHDLAVVRTIAHRAVVMKDGRIVEQGPTEQLFRSPEQPYTQELLAAIPDFHRGTRAS